MVRLGKFSKGHAAFLRGQAPARGFPAVPAVGGLDRFFRVARVSWAVPAVGLALMGCPAMWLPGSAGSGDAPGNRVVLRPDNPPRTPPSYCVATCTVDLSLYLRVIPKTF